MSPPPVAPPLPPAPVDGRRIGLLALTLLVMALIFVGFGLRAGGETALGTRSVDALGTWWFQWWAARYVEGSELGLHTDRLFFPWGKDIAGDTGANLVDALFSVPLRWWGGPTFAWNTLYLLILASNGAAAGLWLRQRGASPHGILLGAAIAALHPTPLFELIQGRPTQAIAAPLLLALGAADRAFREREPRAGWRSAVVAGLMFALTAYVYWFAGLFAALAACLLALSAPPELRLRSALPRLFGMGLLSLLLCAPVALPLGRALAEGAVGGVLPVRDWLSGELSLRSAAGDNIQLCVLGDPIHAVFRSESGVTPIGPALGLVALLAAAAATLAGRRWAAIGLFALLLAVGPAPGGLPNPLYVLLANALPPMARLYWPMRALVLLVPLSALGAATALDRLPPRRRAAAAALSLTLFSLEGARAGQLPLPTWEARTAPAWACLADEAGAVFVLPYGRDHEPLFAQTVFERPMFGGMNERSHALVPAAQQALRVENSFVAALVRSVVDPRDQGAWTLEDRAELQVLGYRWFAWRLDTLPSALARSPVLQRAMRGRLAELLGPPVYQDDTLRFYAPFGGGDPCAAPGAAGVDGAGAAPVVGPERGRYPGDPEVPPPRSPEPPP